MIDIKTLDPQKTVVVATGNAHKVVEIEAILSEVMPGVRVVALGELGDFPDPVEDGADFYENALIKARAAQEQTGLSMAVADDSGLCVDALNGAPGVYSARYGGLDDDVARYRLLLENLRGAGTRAAHFHTSVVCCFPNGNVLEAEGDCHGTIAYAPQGENGFGYDPVFFVPELRKTFAQLTPEEKNAISHRGVALRAFGEKLKEYMENH